MMEGKYDEECTLVLRTTDAAAALVIIFGGDKGEGFSMQIDANRASPDFVRKVPDILRHVAKDIDEQLQKGQVVVELKSRHDDTRK